MQVSLVRDFLDNTHFCMQTLIPMSPIGEKIPLSVFRVVVAPLFLGLFGMKRNERSSCGQGALRCACLIVRRVLRHHRADEDALI